jgi:prepilin-type N-terminal cleavage/methylation domain-containing protein
MIAMRASSRAGFTLVELMAALTLAGLALMASHGLLSTLADAKARLAQRALAQQERATTFAFVRSSLVMSEALASGALPFFGAPDGASYSSYCRVAGGWTEPCRVELHVFEAGDSATLEVRSESSGRRHVMALATRGGRLVYLERRSDGERWRSAWGISIAVPHAVALTSGSDTLVLAAMGSR